MIKGFTSRLRFIAVVQSLLFSLSACGYHLVGHGDGEGAIASDVKTVSIIVAGDSRKMLPLIRQKLAGASFKLVGQEKVADLNSHANLHVRISPLVFVPSAYDLTGIATQYRMVYSGSLSVQRQGKTDWQSGVIQQQGDVYVTGGPASIQASRERLRRDLRKQWLADALGRLRSGF